MRSFILSRLAQLLFPTTLVFSLYLLVRGHNHPGGGFSAGLVTSLAIVIEAFAFGPTRSRARLRSFLGPAFVVGLTLALATGLVPMLFREPFLTHHHVTFGLGMRDYGLSTTLLFDIGVFAVVVGTTTIVLSTLAQGTK